MEAAPGFEPGIRDLQSEPVLQLTARIPFRFQQIDQLLPLTPCAQELRFGHSLVTPIERDLRTHSELLRRNCTLLALGMVCLAVGRRPVR